MIITPVKFVWNVGRQEIRDVAQSDIGLPEVYQYPVYNPETCSYSIVLFRRVRKVWMYPNGEKSTWYEYHEGLQA